MREDDLKPLANGASPPQAEPVAPRAPGGTPLATAVEAPAAQPGQPGGGRGPGQEDVHARLLRERLRVALVGRLSVATVFLAAVLASRVFAHVVDAPIHSAETLVGATCAVAIALASVWWASRVRRIEIFAQAQTVLDVLLVAGAVAAVWSGVPGSAALLFFIPIANAAGLLLERGALTTAAAASGAYFGLLARAVLADPEGTWAATLALPAVGASVMFFAGALMVGRLARRVAEAEEALARSGEEVERLEGVQRALANDLECGLLIADVSGRVRSANPAAQQILGLATTSALGREVNWLIPTLTTAEHERALDTPPGGEIGFVECELRATDGSARRLRVKRTPLVDTYGNHAGELVLLQDMTRILELEERLTHGDEVGLVLGESDGGDGSEAGEGAEDGMIGTCPAMRTVGKLVAKVAQTDATVLVTGESGTGKELVARAIHRRSGRASGPFVVVNCGAIPENLIESELFGHVKGSFTGAIADRPGLFRRAHGGTIFLDEIGELPLNLQVRLLRVLQDHTVMPVGGNSQIPVDVRVVAATNRVLEDLVKAGEYREDLYYRLAVISIPLPPLRERGTRDLEKLIAHFVRQAAERHAKSVHGVSARAMHLLLRYPYPGNVRELENVIEHATTLCEADTIRESDLPESVRESGRLRPAGPAIAAARDAIALPGGDGLAAAGALGEPWSASPLTGAGGADDDLGAILLPIDEGEGLSLDDQLERREKAMLLAALARAEGVKKRAATLLGINYRSFRHRLQKYGLDTQDADVIPRFEPSLPRERSH
jgi:PAS domain S-box-containing protein